jgi:hypothetical protein
MKGKSEIVNEILNNILIELWQINMDIRDGAVSKESLSLEVKKRCNKYFDDYDIRRR